MAPQGVGPLSPTVRETVPQHLMTVEWARAWFNPLGPQSRLKDGSMLLLGTGLNPQWVLRGPVFVRAFPAVGEVMDKRSKPSVAADPGQRKRGREERHVVLLCIDWSDTTSNPLVCDVNEVVLL